MGQQLREAPLHAQSKKLNSTFEKQPSPATSSSVVIPEEASGPVNIIVESSTDLVTWVAANPGSYGATTTRRFFRVRAVAN